MKRIYYSIYIGFFMFLWVLQTQAACLTIKLHYNERVPYLQSNAQGVSGLTASPAVTAFNKAGISFEWHKTPSKRQMLILKENNDCDCIVGWFKNPEREKFAKFTHYIYQDKPQIALARVYNPKIKKTMTVNELLSDHHLRLLVKDGYSYGKFLDDKIAQYKPNIKKTVYENKYMLELVFMDRVDYIFIAPEEALGLIAEAGYRREDFKFIQLTDMPEGEKRYILCTQKVSDDIISRLNQAIVKYVFGK